MSAMKTKLPISLLSCLVTHRTHFHQQDTIWHWYEKGPYHIKAVMADEVYNDKNDRSFPLAFCWDGERGTAVPGGEL